MKPDPEPERRITVRVYTTPSCASCRRAKALLDAKGVEFEEIAVAGDAETRVWLIETTGRRTVPQIFVGERCIGGYDDLVALDRSGELDRLLGRKQ